MTALSASVVIASRGRPDALLRCLAGVAQQANVVFEVVVVADPAGMAALGSGPHADRVKQVAFDEANISVARNLGVAAAAGDVVAFIDDDAVPEPTWLMRLMAAFSDSDVAAAGGFVLGRNGISWQWQARTVDRTGASEPLDLGTEETVILTPTDDRAIRTEGTNMAIRRQVLADMGGFDPSYRYFHDETDLNMRLAADGLKTAIVPRAVVHHGYAANAVRSAARVPRDLFQVGASWAVFLDRHCPEEERAAAWARVRMAERRRALRHMVQGTLEPRDVRRLMAGLAAGFEEGAGRAPQPMPRLPRAASGLKPYPASVRPGHVVLAGRSWSVRTLRDAAVVSVAQGHVTTVLAMSPTALFHRATFRPEGFWEQRGGLFGRSERTDRLFRLWTFGRRTARETERIANMREVPPITPRQNDLEGNDSDG